MGSASERRCYIVTSSLTGWAHTQNNLSRPRWLCNDKTCCIFCGVLSLLSVPVIQWDVITNPCPCVILWSVITNPCHCVILWSVITNPCPCYLPVIQQSLLPVTNQYHSVQPARTESQLSWDREPPPGWGWTGSQVNQSYIPLAGRIYFTKHKYMFVFSMESQHKNSTGHESFTHRRQGPVYSILWLLMPWCTSSQGIRIQEPEYLQSSPGINVLTLPIIG